MINEVRAIFEAVRAQSGLTGGAAVLIRNGNAETCFFGDSDREAGIPVSAKTYFDIASCTKSFTAMTGALAVSQGCFEWDTPAIRYMKDFAVADPFLTAHITPRDMLSHRTGVPRHDFIDHLKIADRTELCRRYRYLEATAGLREKFQYSNQMYVYFGYFLEKATGRTYEEWLMDDLAQRAGLGIRVRSVPNCMAGLEHAKPYRTNGHEAVRVAYSLCPAEAPDGSVRARAEDLARWVMLMAHGGQYDGKFLCAKEQVAQLTRPTTALDSPAPGDPLSCYGLGWRITQRGKKTVCAHAGDLKGFNAKMGFLPGEDSGFAVLVNTNGTGAETIVGEYLLDQLCGTDYFDADALLAKWRSNRAAGDAERAVLTGAPALPRAEAEALCGAYEHPAYGLLRIEDNANGTEARYGEATFVLRQLDGETVGVWTSPFIPEDVTSVRIQATPDGLLLKTTDSPLWHRFRRNA